MTAFQSPHQKESSWDEPTVESEHCSMENDDDVDSDDDDDTSMSSSTTSGSFPSHHVNMAAQRAVDLIERYANVPDPYSNTNDNPWKDPNDMFQHLSKARNDLSTAWRDFLDEKEQQQQHRMEDEEEKKQGDSTTSQDFRALYMDMITDAFADVLEGMRTTPSTTSTIPTVGNTTSEEHPNVDVLVDCLQSGMDLFQSMDEKQGFMHDFLLQDDFHPGDDDDEDVDIPQQGLDNQNELSATDEMFLTPHEVHRRDMGY